MGTKKRRRNNEDTRSTLCAAAECIWLRRFCRCLSHRGGLQLTEQRPGYCVRSTEDAVASVGLPGRKQVLPKVLPFPTLRRRRRGKKNMRTSEIVTIAVS